MIRHSICDLIGRPSSALKLLAHKLELIQDLVVGAMAVEHKVGEGVEGDL